MRNTAIPALITALMCLSIADTAKAQLFDPQGAYTRADSLRGSLGPERTCYDVTAYELSVRVNIADRSISGSNDIYFTAMEDFSRLQIDLFSELTIDGIYFNEKPLKFTREFNAVFVDFPGKVKKGAEGFIRVVYGGKPRTAKNPPWDGGMSWTRDDKGNPWVAVSCQGLGASVWWPNKDHLSDEPERMKINITAPDSLMAVANGNLIGSVKGTDGYTTWKWEILYPINNYNVTLNIGKYVHFGDTYTNSDGSTYALDYYVMYYNLERAKKQFAQVKPMLTCFEQYMGPYPFPKDGYAMVETPYLGMEHQSAVAYGNKYKTGYAGFDYSGIGLDFDYIIIHETAHEWWGNNVSMKDIADMWIHEGFGTYSEAIYVECMYGYETALDYIDHMKKLVSNDAPIIGDYGVNKEGGGDMYHKGAVFIHTLRALTDNDALWWSIVRGIQKDFALQTVTTDQIENYISRKAGKDFSKEFDQYLREEDLPKFEYKLTNTPQGLKVEYRWVADVPQFDMPLRYQNAKGELVWFKPTAEWQEMVIAGLNDRSFKLDTANFWFEQRVVRK